MFLPEGEGKSKENNDQTENLKNLSLSSSNEIITPMEALKKIYDNVQYHLNEETKQRIMLVDTHGHPHLQRDIQYANNGVSTDHTADVANTSSSQSSTEDEQSSHGTEIPQKSNALSTYDDSLSSRFHQKGVVSLTCAISPQDWDAALEYASQSPWILPALGVHPWYLGDILANNTAEISSSAANTPESSPQSNMMHLPTQYLEMDWLTRLETHLSQHPHIIVGEIGLCKMARFVREFPSEKGGKAAALQLQKYVFRKQLELAAKWSRPVTVHCVNMHGIFMEVMKDVLRAAKESIEDQDVDGGGAILQSQLRKAFPPAIAMHSFTGTAHHAQEIMSFENQLLHPEEVGDLGKRRKKKQTQTKQEEPNNTKGDTAKDTLFYFGFSHIINHRMCTSEKARRKGMEAVRSIPAHRLLIESDVHSSEDVALGTAGALAYVAHVRGESIEDVAEQTVSNGLHFLNSLGLTATLYGSSD